MEAGDSSNVHNSGLTKLNKRASPHATARIASHTTYIRNSSSLHSLYPQVLHFAAVTLVLFLYIHCYSSASYADLQASGSKERCPAPVQPQTWHRDLKNRRKAGCRERAVKRERRKEVMGEHWKHWQRPNPWSPRCEGRGASWEGVCLCGGIVAVLKGHSMRLAFLVWGLFLPLFLQYAPPSSKTIRVVIRSSGRRNPYS